MKVRSEIYLLLQQNRLAGMLSMHVDTNVPSFARSFQDVACKVSENKVRKYIYSFKNLSFDDQYQLFLAINNYRILLEFSKNSDRYSFNVCTQTPMFPRFPKIRFVHTYILLKIVHPKFRNSDQKPTQEIFHTNSKNWLDSNGNS